MNQFFADVCMAQDVSASQDPLDPHGEWTEYCSSLTVHHDAKTLQEWAAGYAGGDEDKLKELKDLESVAGRYATIAVTQHGVPIYRQQLPDGNGIILLHFDGKDV